MFNTSRPRPNRTRGLAATTASLQYSYTFCEGCLPLGRSLPPLGKLLVSVWNLCSSVAQRLLRVLRVLRVKIWLVRHSPPVRLQPLAFNLQPFGSHTTKRNWLSIRTQPWSLHPKTPTAPL